MDDDAKSTTGSVFHDDPEKSREKEEADSHMHRYISDQLNRYKSENIGNGTANGEEFETTP